MDDLDEESVTMGGKRSFFTGPLAPYRWRELMSQTLSADERMTRFADGLELLGGAKKLRVPKKSGKKGEEQEIDAGAHLPPLFRDIFRNAFLKFRDLELDTGEEVELDFRRRTARRTAGTNVQHKRMPNSTWWDRSAPGLVPARP